MNDVNQEAKNNAIKTLAILGFIVLIIFGVWLAVKTVQFLPGAFASLANIAGSVDDARPITSINLSADTDTVTTGGAVTLSWEDTGANHVYHFMYECIEDVYVDIYTPSTNEISYVTCGEDFVLPVGTTEIDVYAESEVMEDITLTYTLSVTRGDATATVFEERGTILVLADSEVEEETPDSTDDVAYEDTTDEGLTNTDSTSAPQPTYTYKTVTFIPVSNPNGYTDLRVKVLGTGSLHGNTFTPQSIVDADDDAAIRIEVRNIGTKTSKRWDLEMELPDGTEFELDGESALKPNEYAILTIEFDPEDEDGIESFNGRVSTDEDTKSTNNHFSGTMRFRD